MIKQFEEKLMMFAEKAFDVDVPVGFIMSSSFGGNICFILNFSLSATRKKFFSFEELMEYVINFEQN